MLCSHDGFGVGHTRRHIVVARALRAAAPHADITVVTGLPFTPEWLAESGFHIVRFPALVKDRSGAYSSLETDLANALATREARFDQLIDEQCPDVVLVDRHPFGTAFELTAGLERARRMGARVVLGLRDVLDEAGAVRAEIAGPRWKGVGDIFDEAIVYGDPHLCDHEVEYGIPLPLRYCGWAVETTTRRVHDTRHLTVTSGGGADGHSLFELGVVAVERSTDWRLTIAAGGYVDPGWLGELVANSRASSRIDTHWKAPGCASLFAATGATLQMAGYNSTFEALAAGLKPMLVPRRHPRTEQAIRAERLAALGVADVVASNGYDEVCELLARPRTLLAGATHAAGLRFDGAQRAAEVLLEPRGCARAALHAPSAEA